MHSAGFPLFILLAFSLILSVHADLYVTHPLATSTCSGGQPCLVQWLDDGEAPLLSDIGACFVGLYDARQVLVQQIVPVDVSNTHSFQFTPDPHAGPNSDTYYINFTSVSLVGTARTAYVQYSPQFTLTGMSGSLSSPVPSDTAPISIPATVASPPPDSIISTTTIGAPLNTPSVRPPSASQSAATTPSPSSTAAPSTFATSRVAASSSSASASSASALASASASVSASISTSAALRLRGGGASSVALAAAACAAVMCASFL